MMNNAPGGSDPSRRGFLEWGEAGIGLAEVIAATLIATLAVLGLAYSLGIGRGLIDRYLIARAAEEQARLAVDSLLTQTPVSLRSDSCDFWVNGVRAGRTCWIVTPVDDPVDGLASSSPSDPQPEDMKRILVQIRWPQPGGSEVIRLVRIVPNS